MTSSELTQPLGPLGATGATGAAGATGPGPHLKPLFHMILDDVFGTVGGCACPAAPEHTMRGFSTYPEAFGSSERFMCF